MGDSQLVIRQVALLFIDVYAFYCCVFSFSLAPFCVLWRALIFLLYSLHFSHAFVFAASFVFSLDIFHGPSLGRDRYTGQMTGKWRVKHPNMAALKRLCDIEVQRVSISEWKHVPRDKNILADQVYRPSLADFSFTHILWLAHQLCNDVLDGRRVSTEGQTVCIPPVVMAVLNAAVSAVATTQMPTSMLPAPTDGPRTPRPMQTIYKK